MLIGSRYAINKIYSGIKHYNSLPLTSEDIHEYRDTLSEKYKHLTDNLIGSGTLTEPVCSVSSVGIKLASPSILLVQGDVVAIQNSSSKQLVLKSTIASSGISSGALCVVGWYQPINHMSTVREYGGVNNDILPNDIVDDNLDIQVSTRYQFRWDVMITSKASLSDSSMTFHMSSQDETGRTSGSGYDITATKVGGLWTAPTPNAMISYAGPQLFIIPILYYTYAGNTITSALAVKAIRAKGSSEFVSSITEPSGSEYNEGTIWYNPSTHKFKFYVTDSGFVDVSTDLALMHYDNTVTMSSNNTNASVDVSIGMSTLTSSDYLRVVYEGATLIEDVHYIINYTTNKITLLNFTTHIGDVITFLILRLVNITTATTIAAEFNTHRNTLGNATTKGHVQLSDVASTLGVSSNTAATPKAIYEATSINDTTTNKKYKFVMVNQVLYLEEL